MSQDLSLSSWFLVNDELDQLEAAFECIFLLHETTKNKTHHKLEEDILHEHIEAEEKTEQVIESFLKKEEQGHNHEQKENSSTSSQKKNSVKDFLASSLPSDPLCRQTFLLTQPLRIFAEEWYVKRAFKNRNLFRLWVNAHVLPAKVAVALSGASEAEEMPAFVIASELSLAVLYAHRIRHSLFNLQNEKILPDKTEFLVETFDVLRSALLVKQKEYEQKAKFFGSHRLH